MHALAARGYRSEIADGCARQPVIVGDGELLDVERSARQTRISW
jgi:hypothetical protein